jgi:hypothetical protein
MSPLIGKAMAIKNNTTATLIAILLFFLLGKIAL